VDWNNLYVIDIFEIVFVFSIGFHFNHILNELQTLITLNTDVKTILIVNNKAFFFLKYTNIL